MLAKEITEAIVNEADKGSTEFRITRVDFGDRVVTGDLYNDKEERIAKKRVYFIDYTPFSFEAGDLEYLSEEVPKTDWNKAPIIAWLEDHQVGEEEAAVEGQAYFYMTKVELLKLVVELMEE